jgi:hydrogenase nickel incorporation protein HypB
MCATCGCSDDPQTRIIDMQTGATRPLGNGDTHRHGHTVRLEREILSRNDDLARHNRDWLLRRGVLALNLVSSPGAGKTTLLERTLRDLGSECSLSVIEGDQETDRDARRIQEAGGRAIQINTGTACHLDASMISRALPLLDPPAGGIVMIENVGNLVCPALFDLGERARVVIASVTEGDDKPLKYPHMFRGSHLLLLNKIDLLPYVSFEVARFEDAVKQVNASLPVLCVSATRGDGLAEWYAWLRGQRCGVEGVSAGDSRADRAAP